MPNVPAHFRKIYITRHAGDGSYRWRIRWCRPAADGTRDFLDVDVPDDARLVLYLAQAMADMDRLVSASVPSA